MNDKIRTSLVILAGIVSVTAMVIMGMALSYPEIVRQTSLGGELFLADLHQTSSGVSAAVQFKPLADLLLLISSYLLVCAFFWTHERLKDYLKTRGHV